MRNTRLMRDLSERKTLRVLGLMSGTSLDGVDLAYCTFSRRKGSWHYRILEASTIPYNREWHQVLSSAHLLTGEALISCHSGYGRYLGKLIQSFIVRHKLKGKVDAISSHGHTIFHQPSNGFTFQLGDGGAIHSVTGLPVIGDFRSLDVQLGGQGAPLVPIGDRLLFGSYTCCVNLGGIANLSMERKGKRIAWDICFMNMALNHLAREAGQDFDRNGKMARRGSVQPELLAKLESHHGRSLIRASLGREDFERDILPHLKSGYTPEDRLRTFIEYAARQVGSAVRHAGKGKVLLTGGGAHNGFFRERLMEAVSAGGLSVTFEPQSDANDEGRQIIDFKEALVFAFLGVLRLNGEANALSSVTGASRDSCSGITYGC